MRAAESGFKGLALQLSTYTSADVLACQAHGLEVLGWGIASSSDGADLSHLGASAYVPQIEGPGQRDSAVLAFQAGIGGSLIRGIVTDFSGLEDPAQAARVVTYITVTYVECYFQDSPIHAELGLMLRQATQYGLPRPVPVIGLYDDVGTESYPEIGAYAPRFAVWRGLQMPERAWAQVRALAG
jgi:hypothetical protein